MWFYAGWFDMQTKYWREDGGSLIEFSIFSLVAVILIGGLTWETSLKSSSLRSSSISSILTVNDQNFVLGRSTGGDIRLKPTAEVDSNLIAKLQKIKSSGESDYSNLSAAILEIGADNLGNTTYSVSNIVSIMGVASPDLAARAITKAQQENIQTSAHNFYLIYDLQIHTHAPELTLVPARIDPNAALIEASFTGTLANNGTNYSNLYNNQELNQNPIPKKEEATNLPPIDVTIIDVSASDVLEQTGNYNQTVPSIPSDIQADVPDISAELPTSYTPSEQSFELEIDIQESGGFH